MPSAPHLPSQPPAPCHERAFSLRGLAFIILFSFLTSAAVTLATIVWILPSSIPSYVSARIDDRQRSRSGALDESAAAAIRQRQVMLFDRRLKVAGELYPASDVPRAAVLLSADGWSVAPGKFLSGAESWLVGIDHIGLQHNVQKIVEDAVAGLTYIKFSGQNFRAAPLSDGEDSPESGWIVERERALSAALAPPPSGDDGTARPIWQARAGRPVATSAILPAPLWSGDGELIGLADASGILIPSAFIKLALPQVLSAGRASHAGAPWRGYFVFGAATADKAVKTVHGFYVRSLDATVKNSPVRAGDVILEINGQPVQPNTIAYQILSAPKEFTVTIFRNGKEKDVVVTKVPIIPAT